jgi:hypothetical protein
MVAEVRKRRRFGFVVAYLLVFLVVMRYVFQVKDFK